PLGGHARVFGCQPGQELPHATPVNGQGSLAGTFERFEPLVQPVVQGGAHGAKCTPHGMLRVLTAAPRMRNFTGASTDDRHHQNTWSEPLEPAYGRAHGPG